MYQGVTQAPTVVWVSWSQWLSRGRACVHTNHRLTQPCPTDSKDWQASLQALSLPELSQALEDRVHEMGESLGGQPMTLTPTQGPDTE